MGNITPKVSVIVPVYNTERYVEACIESILKQHYPELELVLVNDGSTDRSLLIIREYEQRYPDIIRVVDKANEGVDRARRTGLDHSTGELVMFVDSDDKLAFNAINRAYQVLKEQDVDVVSFEATQFYSIFRKNSPLSPDGVRYYDRRLEHEEMMNKLYLAFMGIQLMPVTIWGKLYKSSLFEGWEPTGLKFGEDQVAYMRIFPKIRSMYLLPDRLYLYRMGGVTGHYMPDFLEQCKALYTIRKMEAINQNYPIGYRSLIWELKSNVITHIEQLLFERKETDAEWLKREFRDWVYDDFDRFLNTGEHPKNAIEDAIYHRDAERTWSLMKTAYNPWSMRNMAKRVIGWTA